MPDAPSNSMDSQIALSHREAKNSNMELWFAEITQKKYLNCLVNMFINWNPRTMHTFQKNYVGQALTDSWLLYVVNVN